MKAYSFASAALLSASLAFAPSAMAQSAETQTVAVPYADLDLSTEEGVQRLDQRIDRAARAVCGYNKPVTGSRIRSAEAHQCYTEARSRIARQQAQLVERARARTIALNR